MGLGILATLAATLLQPVSASAQCAVSNNDFTFVDIARNLNEPMEIDIDARERVFIAERQTGAIKILNQSTGNITTAVTLPNLYKSDKNHSVGLIGMALHPNFEVNKWIFVLYSTDVPADPGKMRLSRLTVEGNSISMNSEKVVLEYPLNYRCCHQAGSIEFGKDGQLFISTGNAETGVDFEKSLAVTPNPKSWAGKMLRIKPEDDGTYTIPAGNLYSNPNDGIPEIYLSGLRNPFRIGVDKQTNWVYWGDVGPDGPRMEELNQARQAGFFGYPYFFGMNEPTPVTGSQTPGAPTFNGKPLSPAMPALITYAHQQKARLRQNESGTQLKEMDIPGACPFSGPVYHYTDNSPSKKRLPKAWDKRWFAMEMNRDSYYVATFNSGGYINTYERIWTNLVTENPMDMAVSPRGDLYILVYGTTWRAHNSNSGIYKVEYTGNCNPVVNEQTWLAEQATSVFRDRLAARAGAMHAIPLDSRRILLPNGATGVDVYDVHGKLVWSRHNGIEASGWVEMPDNLGNAGLLFAKFKVRQ